ncbi:MAG: hypothetical protein ACJAWQ_002388 [Paraglaciecola sp.]
MLLIGALCEDILRGKFYYQAMIWLSIAQFKGLFCFKLIAGDLLLIELKKPE